MEVPQMKSNKLQILEVPNLTPHDRYKHVQEDSRSASQYEDRSDNLLPRLIWFLCIQMPGEVSIKFRGTRGNFVVFFCITYATINQSSGSKKICPHPIAQPAIMITRGIKFLLQNPVPDNFLFFTFLFQFMYLKVSNRHAVQTFNIKRFSSKSLTFYLLDMHKHKDQTIIWRRTFFLFNSWWNR